MAQKQAEGPQADIARQRQANQQEIEQRQTNAADRIAAERAAAASQLRQPTEALPDAERAQAGARIRELHDEAEAELRGLPSIRRAHAHSSALEEMHQRFGQLEQRRRAVADARVTQKLGAAPERTLDAALNEWQLMRQLKRSVAADPAADATKFKDWLAGHDRVLKQVFAPERLADLNKIARASEMLNRAPAPKGTVQFPKLMAGKFSDADVGPFFHPAMGRVPVAFEFPTGRGPTHRP